MRRRGDENVTGDLPTPVHVISRKTFMPYGITEVEESTDGSGFNIRDLTTNKPTVHFAYATPQDAREAVRLAERLIANAVVITPHPLK
jgi:hypothetical protein